MLAQDRKKVVSVIRPLHTVKLNTEFHNKVP